MKEHIYVGSVENTSLLHTYNLNIWTIAPPPPRKIAPRLQLGFGSRLGLVLGLGLG